MRKTLCSLLLLCVAASAVAPAQANYALAPSNPVIHDPMTTSGLALARNWWARLGVFTPCATVTPRLFDDPGTVGLAATLGFYEPTGWRCTIWIQAQFRYDADQPVAAHRRPYARIAYCQMLLHEYGHAAGLTHADGGIMSVDPAHPVSPPGACWTWALATVAAERQSR